MDVVRGKCLICSTPNNNSMHLGIESCRACANFFIRTTLSRNKYTCRQGTRKCVIARNERFLCRGCRFDRCIALGMEYEERKPKLNFEFLFQTLVSPSNETLLERIGRAYDASINRRRIREQNLIRNFQGAARLYHKAQELYISHFEFVFSVHHITIDETRRLFSSSFPSLADLSASDQREMYRWYFPIFVAADACYRTQLVWGDLSSYAMSTILMCVDLVNPESWITPSQADHNRSTILDSVRNYQQGLVALLLPSFQRIQLKEREMHTLLALALTECDPKSEVSLRVQNMLDSIRTDALRELRRFYNEEGISDHSTRLGNLMTLCHTIREGQVLFQEFFRMQITMFDLHSTQTLLQEMFL